jgi:hypothetical protein
MLALLTAIPSLLGGLFGSINHITDAISNEKIAVVNAKTQEEQTAAQERVNTLTLRRDLMIAEAGQSRINVYVRAMLALGPTVFLLKIFLWDKTIGPFFGCVGKVTEASCKLFLTDPLDPNLWQVISVVLGFYFLTEAATGVTRIIRGSRGNGSRAT